MKKTALFIVITLAHSTWSWAANSPDAYKINVNVMESHWIWKANGNLSGYYLMLKVWIAGTVYEMESVDMGDPRKLPVLVPGSYLAKLVQDEHSDAYEYFQTYELLFPDNKTKEFVVMGQTAK
jgi:hypothetical protein